MKKGWKVFWITSLVIACIGFVLCCTGIALGATYQDLTIRFPNGIGYVDGNSVLWNNTEDENATSIKAQEYQNITSIKAEIASGILDVVEYDGTTIKVESTDSKNVVNVYLKGDNTLILKSKTNFIGNGYNSHTIIYLPKNIQLEKASFAIGAGEMTIENINAATLSIEVGAGKATVNNSNSKDLKIECGAGEIEMYTTDTNEAEVECGIGKVGLTVAGMQNDYNYNVECGIGSVTIGDNNYSGIGHDQKINNGSNKQIDINCGIGQVEVYFE
ncbi:MAG: DUF4097 family beta strand repeat-containing protein [Lachnospiraceae bacterium]|nr:DUF4097 family beta strand repeat-containing protein [Lachnospiraceae bacterium]